MPEPNLQVDCAAIKAATDKVHNCANEGSRAQGGDELKNASKGLPGSGLEGTTSAASASLTEARNTFARRLEEHVDTINFAARSLANADINAARFPKM